MDVITNGELKFYPYTPFGGSTNYTFEMLGLDVEILAESKMTEEEQEMYSRMAVKSGTMYQLIDEADLPF